MEYHHGVLEEIKRLESLIPDSNWDGAKLNLDEFEVTHGNADEEQRLFEAAIVVCDKAIEVFPKYPYAYDLRGIARSILDDFESAIPDFDKAIQINAKEAGFYSNRGRTKPGLVSPRTIAEMLRKHGVYMKRRL